MRLLQSLLLLRNDVTTKSQGVGGGFGLLGEQSLQQPPPAFHATSASGGHPCMSPFGGETVSQCRMVIARRLSGVVAISCIRLLRRLLQSLLLLRNGITTQPEGVGGGCQFIQGAQRNPAYSDCPSRNPCHFHLRQRRTNQKRSFNYLIDDVIIYWGIKKRRVLFFCT